MKKGRHTQSGHTHYVMAGVRGRVKNSIVLGHQETDALSLLAAIWRIVIAIFKSSVNSPLLRVIQIMFGSE